MDRLDAFAGRGFQPIQFDWTDPRAFSNLPIGQLSANSRVLIAVSYDRRSRHSRYDSQVGGLQNLLARLPEDARIVYISTTGVYHQRDGSWVDCPVVRGEFYREIARQVGAAPPEFVAPDQNAPDRMRSDSNKRVWNRKLRHQLLPVLEFPDYRRGLADVL